MAPKKSKNATKSALITGITGQDGSYLAELLLTKGYRVHGVVRRSSTYNRQRIEKLDNWGKGAVTLHYGDLTDMASVLSAIKLAEPDEIYNLAAQSHVQVSFETPLFTAHVDAIGTLNVLEAARMLDSKAKIYQASTSELYSGDPKECPQNEKTPFKPRSPYGVAKLYAYNIARIYRESYGMFISNGILFNHESERRGENFVSRKITLTLKEIAAGMPRTIKLGNLDAKRDWGHAKDYVEAMYLILQLNKPDDYVIATGIQHSVREFCELACKEAGFEIIWKGKGLDEKGFDKKTGKLIVEVDPAYFRPNEVWSLQGDISKARKDLGWTPKISFDELVRLMVRSDVGPLKVRTKSEKKLKLRKNAKPGR